MEDFARANFDSISELNKAFLDKEQELQKSKQDLVVAEAHHKQEIHLLKKEHEDNLK